MSFRLCSRLMNAEPICDIRGMSHFPNDNNITNIQYLLQTFKPIALAASQILLPHVAYP